MQPQLKTLLKTMNSTLPNLLKNFWKVQYKKYVYIYVAPTFQFEGMSDTC
jgi:hypothetical protein